MSLLEVKDLRKTFIKRTGKGNIDVLKGISFSIEKGEIVSILGSSGSGKTTLLRCLNFLDTPKGKILINGNTIFDSENKERLTDDQIRKRRKHFGMVFQNFNLFPQYSVLKNVTLAPTLQKLDTNENIEKEAIDIIESVGLSNKINSYPCELSGGQQQRVAIARALALKPDILCFDEPTSALDPELTGEVLRVIKGLKSSDRTMIIVTHEMEFARNVSDKIIFMADGIIEESGTPEDFFDNPKSEKAKAFLQHSLEKI